MNGEQHQYCSPHRVRRPFRRAELPARLASRSRTAGERFKGSKAWWAWASAESGSKQAARMRLKREQEVCWPNQAEGYSQRRPVVVKPLPLNLPYLAFADSEAFRDEFARLRYRQTVVLRISKGCQKKPPVAAPAKVFCRSSSFPPRLADTIIHPGFALRAGSATMPVYLGLADGFLSRSAFLLPHVTR